MRKLDRIKDLLETALKDTIYEKDYKLSLDLITHRKFEDLLELIKSVKVMEENKPKPERIDEYVALVVALVEIIGYVDQLNYNPDEGDM